MSKMTVIQLLNKIANGEEVPTLIKINNNIFKYRYDVKDYTDTTQYFFGEYIFQEDTKKELNTEVEIIEENKKIKKIEKLYKYIDKEVDEKEKDMYYENILKVYDDSEYEIDESISFIVDKINEIIDYLEEKE